MNNSKALLDALVNPNSISAIGINLTSAEEDEVEVAAYLSLWLCCYVLPSGDNLLSPGTFKAASIMARDKIYSLAPPVLACIYDGLTQTSLAYNGRRELGKISQHFPAHFLHAWVATYLARGVYTSINNKWMRPIICRYAGINNTFQMTDPKAIDCRILLRGDMCSKDFCWDSKILP